jgi:anti-sigma regulatory factor (Ser/Thr protein kinase)
LRVIFEFAATPAEVMRAVEIVEELARSKGLGEKWIFGLKLAIEECASNIVNHAYQRDPERTFQMDVEESQGAFVVELCDHGPRFDPTAKPQRPPAQDDDLPGGWGIELVRKQIDEMNYRRDGEMNRLRLTKKFDPAMD